MRSELVWVNRKLPPYGGGTEHATHNYAKEAAKQGLISQLQAWEGRVHPRCGDKPIIIGRTRARDHVERNRLWIISTITHRSLFSPVDEIRRCVAAVHGPRQVPTAREWPVRVDAVIYNSLFSRSETPEWEALPGIVWHPPLREEVREVAPILHDPTAPPEYLIYGGCPVRGGSLVERWNSAWSLRVQRSSWGVLNPRPGIEYCEVSPNPWIDQRLARTVLLNPGSVESYGMHLAEAAWLGLPILFYPAQGKEEALLNYPGSAPLPNQTPSDAQLRRLTRIVREKVSAEEYGRELLAWRAAFEDRQRNEALAAAQFLRMQLGMLDHIERRQT